MINFFKRLINNNGLFSKVSDFKYINIYDYEKELENVNSELLDVENTIDYYINRKKILNEWKHRLEITIAKWDEEDNCRNCKFYTKLYCNKFESTVSPDATCDSFEWTSDELDL